MKEDKEGSDSTLEEILKLTWGAYHSMIFHNTQIGQLLKESFNSVARRQKWDINSKSQVFKDFMIPANGYAEQEFEKMAAQITKQEPAFEITDSFLEHNAGLSPDSIYIRLIDVDNFGDYRFPIEIYCAHPGNIAVDYVAEQSKFASDKISTTGFLSLQNKNYTLLSEVYLYPGKPKGRILFNLPQKGRYTLFIAQQHHTAVSFTIRPNKNLLYVNQRVLPMNAVLLQDDRMVNPADNKYLAVYAPGMDSITYSMLYNDAINMVELYNYKGNLLKLENKRSPFHISCFLKKEDKRHFVYFSNKVFRWPPVFKNIPPWFFFIKFPVKK
jgi:hypothetical protein